MIAIENNSLHIKTTNGPGLLGGDGLVNDLKIVHKSPVNLLNGPQLSGNWNNLLNQVEIIVGKRAANLFGYGVAAAIDSLRCIAFFSDYFIAAGEDLDHILLNGAEDDLLNFAEAIARNNGKDTYDLFENLSPYYTNSELATLVTFAGQIIATGIFYNVLDNNWNEA